MRNAHSQFVASDEQKMKIKIENIVREYEECFLVVNFYVRPAVVVTSFTHLNGTRPSHHIECVEEIDWQI